MYMYCSGIYWTINIIFQVYGRYRDILTTLGRFYSGVAFSSSAPVS